MAGQEESGEPTALPVHLISPETIQAREKVTGIIDSRQALQEEVQGMDTSVFPPQSRSESTTQPKIKVLPLRFTFACV